MEPGYALTRSVLVVLLTLIAGATLFLTGFAVGSGDGHARADSADVVPLPDWFVPIWDAYDRDPAIMPWFDFASLHAPPAAKR